MIVVDIEYNRPACLRCAIELALESDIGPGRWWKRHNFRRVDEWDIYNSCPCCGFDFTAEARAARKDTVSSHCAL